MLSTLGGYDGDFYIKSGNKKIAYVTVYNTGNDTFIKVKGDALDESATPDKYLIKFEEFKNLKTKKQDILLYFLLNNLETLTDREKESKNKISEDIKQSKTTNNNSEPLSSITVYGVTVPLLSTTKSLE